MTRGNHKIEREEVMASKAANEWAQRVADLDIDIVGNNSIKETTTGASWLRGTIFLFLPSTEMTSDDFWGRGLSGRLERGPNSRARSASGAVALQWRLGNL